MSFTELLRAKVSSVRQDAPPKKPQGYPSPSSWPKIVERLHGRPGYAGEWIAARDLFEALGVTDRDKPSCSRSVAALMRSHGWLPKLVGPRHCRRRGYVRPFAPPLCDEFDIPSTKTKSE
jgi:hypothetical protein